MPALIQVKAPDPEILRLLSMLLRLGATGDASGTNLTHVERMMGVLSSHTAWILARPPAVSAVFFALLRWAPDHTDARLSQLLVRPHTHARALSCTRSFAHAAWLNGCRCCCVVCGWCRWLVRRCWCRCRHGCVGQFRESNLAEKLWKAAPNACVSIGRELARRLRDARGVGFFADLWRVLRAPWDARSNPKVPEGVTYAKLLQQRTPKALVRSLITPLMERQVRCAWFATQQLRGLVDVVLSCAVGGTQLLFLFNNVREGNQRRYLQWFAAKHLSGRESDHLLPDVARFIVSAFHPKADLIRSTAVPRWVIISWLLTVCKDKAKAVRVQHAVFTDWLPPRGGGVMDFEPGMLLIVRARWCMVPCLCAMC